MTNYPPLRRLDAQTSRGKLADLGEDFAEGTVYFVIRTEDLAARDFTRVHAIYQQT